MKYQYNVVNKGYGQETTSDMLRRFDKDVVALEPQYTIIQGGTNDLYRAMAEANTTSEMNAKMQIVKNNIMEMVHKAWSNGIIPIVGTLLPRSNMTELGKVAFVDYNNWIISWTSEQNALGNACSYIDFFNAGKDFDPPEPLEDPNNPLGLNPLYDGDVQYDEFGNVTKQGNGIHPSVEGYRIMGSCIPLTLFKTSDTGFKLYKDAECTIEENYNDSDKTHPYYELDIRNVKRGKEKTIIRYIKNIGNNQALYIVYGSENDNLKYHFVSDNEESEYISGLCNPQKIVRIEIRFTAEFEKNDASFKLHLAGRELSVS